MMTPLATCKHVNPPAKKSDSVAFGKALFFQHLKLQKRLNVILGGRRFKVVGVNKLESTQNVAKFQQSLKCHQPAAVGKIS